MSDPLLWAALLLVFGFVLVLLEVFVPSGGILGFLAASAVFGAVVMAFYHRGAAYGFGFVAVSLVVLPTLLALGLKYWPRTAIGRRVILNVPSDKDTLPEDTRRIKDLVGKHGVAKTPMLPSGAILIDGKTIDAVSQGMAIDPGQRVVVLEVRSNRVVVRPAEADEHPPEAGRPDILSRPVDELGLDDFDEPLS